MTPELTPELEAALAALPHEKRVYPDAEPEASDDYWTEERVAAAQPTPPPSPEELKASPAEAGPPQQLLDALRSFPPSLLSFDGDGSGMSTEEVADGEVTKANVKQRPFWNGGKLYYTMQNGNDFVASAQFVASNRVLMTAAHCIIDIKTGLYNKNFQFRRAYNDGGGQKVSIIGDLILTAYYNNGSVNGAYDYAFMRTGTDSGAGWLGFQTGLPYNKFTAIGYPSNYFGGKSMARVTGTKGNITSNIATMVDNPMGPGCSGGAWIGDVITDHVGGNYAIGLNSSSSGSPDDEQGPYFDSLTYALLLKVLNW